MRAKKKTDRRIQRTRHSLTHAMVDLVTEKRFDDITVQNLIDRADIGRSTFYTHFRDKEDLFQKNWEGFLDFCVEQIIWDKVGKGSFFPVLFLFDHLKDVQPFYRGLVLSRKSEPVMKTGAEYLSQKLGEGLLANLKYHPSIPIPILANYLATELFALLKWWLDQGMPYSPERMDQIFHELVNPAFQSLKH
ncbi:MAG TPA: TetR/AcrR family transcriptional regulator [Pyrinomonadaceae bacterium]|nr:TetR/AcrR family transcriptional regulator [Pyrinomonadaceae bacterium]